MTGALVATQVTLLVAAHVELITFTLASFSPVPLTLEILRRRRGSAGKAHRDRHIRAHPEAVA